MNTAQLIEAANEHWTPWTVNGDMIAPPAVGRIAQLTSGVPTHSNATQHVAPQATNDNLPPVIALTGLAGAGKSTVAAMLIERGYTLVKFAGPLKAMISALGFTDWQVENDRETRYGALNGKTMRHAQQALGTEWGRKCMGEDFWLELWRHEVQRADGHVVVDDCRFPNEATAVRQLGGVIWSIEGRGGIAGNHASESGIGSAPDRIITNTGPVTELRAAVSYALGYVN